MNRFFRNYARTVFRPASAFADVLEGPYFRDGFLYMGIPLVLYTLMDVLLNLGGGAPSTFTPWLNIPKESYYFYSQFLLAPSLLLAWFSAAALVQVLARAFRGTGAFEQTLAILGLSTSVAMWGTLLHDLLMAFFSAVRSGLIGAAGFILFQLVFVIFNR